MKKNIKKYSEGRERKLATLIHHKVVSVVLDFTAIHIGITEMLTGRMISESLND